MNLPCPHCGVMVTASDELAGINVDCPACKKPMPIPGTPSPGLQVYIFQEWLNHKTPYAFVTKAIIALNVIVFLAMIANGVSAVSPTSDQLRAWGGNQAPLTRHGEWWRLFSSIFVHAGLLHIGFNMWALASTGPLVERMFGNWFFAVLYLFAGLTGSLASVTFNPSSVVSVGASGAIFGVFGALLALVMTNRMKIPMHVLTHLRNSTITFVGYNLYIGFHLRGVDNAAHIGGLVGGFFVGLLLSLQLTGPRQLTDEPPRSSWIASLLTVLTVVAIGAGLIGAMSRGYLHWDTPEVKIVKLGHFDDHPDVTIGQALARFMPNATWESARAPTGHTIVEAHGTVPIDGQSADIIMQFVFVGNQRSFMPRVLVINGHPQNEFNIGLFIIKMMKAQ